MQLTPAVAREGVITLQVFNVLIAQKFGIMHENLLVMAIEIHASQD